MPLISGKCPECGAALKISDQAKGELICPYCGSSYLVEKAVNITNVETNNGNIYADNVQISLPQDESRMETRVIDRVDEEDYESVISLYESFGWEVKNAQKIDYNTTTASSFGNSVTYQNNRTVYWTITFQRNRLMKNYERLNDLFNEYLIVNQDLKKTSSEKYDLLHKKDQILPAAIALSFFMILSAIVFISSFAEDTSRVEFLIIGILLVILPVVMLFFSARHRIYFNRKKKAAMRENNYTHLTLAERKKNILSEAKLLLD